MSKAIFYKTLFSLLLVFSISQTPVLAQVHKWVDDEGNIHFGDKPKDNKTAEKSEAVDIKPSYVPGEALPEEQVEAQKSFLKRKSAEREQKKKEQEQATIKRNSLNKECAKLREKLKRFTHSRLENGKVKRVDYFVENGKSVSTSRQKEIIAKLKKRLAKKCG